METLPYYTKDVYGVRRHYLRDPEQARHVVALTGKRRR